MVFLSTLSIILLACFVSPSVVWSVISVLHTRRAAMPNIIPGYAVVMAAACCASNASAEDPAKLAREVRSGWIVMPVEEAVYDKTVRHGDMVLHQRLLPLGYSTLDGDAVDGASGEIIVPRGTGMIRMMANTGIVECAIGLQKENLLGQSHADFSAVHVCLRDTDKDGRFDEYAHYNGSVEGLPSINGRMPKTLHALKTPVGYTRSDPRSMTTAYFLGLRHEGKAVLGGMPVFADVFGHDNKLGTLDRAWPRDNEGTGKTQPIGMVLLKGAMVEVVGDDGDGLKIHVTRPFPRGIFSINQVGSNGFY